MHNRKRSRSLYHEKKSNNKKLERKNSDDYKSCIVSFWISQEEISAQNKKIKNQLAWIIEHLNKNECIILTKWLLSKFASDTHVELTSREYLAKTSKRFRKLFHVNCSPRSLCTNSDSELNALDISFHFSESDSDSPEVSPKAKNYLTQFAEKITQKTSKKNKKIPELDFNEIREKPEETNEQTRKDVIRLRSHLNIVLRELSPRDTLLTLEHVLFIFPHMRKLNSEFFKYVSPRLRDLL